MGQIASVGTVGEQTAPIRADTVRAAIVRAAQTTGVDFDYLLAQAKIESSLDPAARAPTSSAAGLYQFTAGTWLTTLDRHGAAHGLGWAGAAIDGGRVSDPGMRAQIMALRFDPSASALMAAELANDNRAELQTALGRDPDSAELYLAHFLGTAGAKSFLGALASDPGMAAAGLMPQAAAANRTIFFERSGAPRSLGGVMELIRSKVATAMEDGSFAISPTPPITPGQPLTRGPLQHEFRAAALPPQSAPRLSMAETLRATFGANGPAVPASVRSAYAKLAAFGL